MDEYFDFFDDELHLDVYKKLVLMMILEKRQNIIININDLRNTLPNRLKELLNNFCEEQTILMSALHKFVSQLDPGYAQEHANFYVGFKGSFGSHHVTPRTMSSKFAGK